MKPRPQSASKSVPAKRRQKPQVLAQSLSRFGSAAAITAALLGSAAVQAPATTFYWDTDGTDVGNSTAGAGLGGTGTWDLVTANWWDAANPLTLWGNTNADIAVFSGTYGVLPTANTATLSSGIIANRASFIRSGYLLTGGDLTLAGSGAGLHANLAESATIDSQILGTAGLTKTGGGSIRLGNALNGYTGTTTISNGTLIISDPAALGSDTSAVVVTGFNNNPGNATNLRGMGGGSLLLDGLSSPITFTRDLSLQGQGPIADRGGALISLGDNTLSGTVTAGALAFGVTPITTSLISATGTLNLTGTLNVGGTALATATTLGGANQGTVSNYNLTGVLAGTGILIKQGSGTLFLNPSSSAGFSGSIRTVASVGTGQSSIRITSGGVLGTRTGTTTGSVLDLNGGILQVLMDAPGSFLSGSTAAPNVYGRGSTTIFVDQGVAGTATNQTVNFGQFAFEENQTFTFNSRNGYGISFGVAPVQGGNNVSTFNNNLQGGLLTFTGNFWSNTDNGASRTFTLGGAGFTLIDGSIVASAAGFNHNFIKTGTGTLTVTGAASTLDGDFRLEGGTVATRRIVGGILGTGTAAGELGFGAAAATGTLNYDGAVTTGAGETLTRTIRLRGTTGGARINANQAGGSPTALIINGPIVVDNPNNNKTLTLGGTAAASIENQINTPITNPGTGTFSVTKTDAATWVLGAHNTYTGTTTISNGTLRLAATAGASNVLADVAPLAFNADVTTQAAGGRLVFSGATGVATTETVGTLSPVAGHGTVRVENGGALTTLNLGAISALSGSSAVSVNFEAPAANDVITLPGTVNTFVQGNAYFNGSNFAYRGTGNVLRAPVYGTDAGFVTSAVALTGGSHNELTGSIGPITNTTVSSLRISGSRTITITGGNTLGINTGTRTVGGIIVTGGAATITGGAVGTFTGNGGALAIRTDAASDSLTLASSISNNVTAGLVKSGLGTLILSGSNNQAGGVQINEGTVQLSGTGRLSAVNGGLVIRQNATLDLNGVTQASNIVTAFNGAGRITNSSATALNLTVGNNSQGGTFSGSIDEVNGQINFTKVGPAGLNLSGSSNYTGDTIIGGASTGGISASILANIGSASSIGAGDGTSDTTNRESLVLSGTSAVSVTTGVASPNFLQYVGTANATTNRLFSLGAIGAGAGGRIISSGVNGAGVVFSNTGEIGYVGSAGTAAQTLVLSGGNTADNRIDLHLRNSSTGGGNLAINKQDGGKWVLTNSLNNYSGATKINGGVLEVTGTALPTTSALLFGGTLAIPTGGVIETSGLFTRALNAGTVANTVNFNANGNFAGSGGFAASGSKLTVNLGTSAPNLSWGSGGFLMPGTAAATLRLGSVTAQSEVEFQNGILLNGGSRTIQVDDNANIGTDFAHISGVIADGSAAANLVKAGAGILSLSGANTYTGSTRVDGGSIIVRSLGNSASPGATSIGDSTVGNTNAGALELGNGGTGAGFLQYVGAGETSDRKIRLNTTTGSPQIHADGAGPLILTNVANDMVAGAKTFFLRGTNAAGNRITSQLSDNGGALSVTVDGSATWILTGANSYTGTTSVNAGALGIGNNLAAGVGGTVVLNFGNIFAYGDDRTLANPVTLNNNATMGFLGDYSLTFSTALTNAAAANNVGINNGIVTGKSLTFTGMNLASLTANRTLTVDGPGHTIVNGNITNTTATAFGLAIAKTGNGILELRGTGGNFNQNNAGIDIDRGTLRIGANEVIPHTSTSAAGVTFSPEAGTENDTATLDLNGFNETITVLNMAGAGSAIIDNTSSNAASLTFGQNNGALTFGTSTATRAIMNSGGGALSIVKTGTTAASIPLGYTITHTGTTTVANGSLSIASAVNGSTGLTVNNNVSGPTSLALTGGITSSAVTSVIVQDNGTLSLLNGAGNQLNQLTTLTLGSTGGANTTLRFNAGDIGTPGDNLNTDLLSLASGTLNLFTGNTITFDISDAGLNPNQQYILLDATAIGGGFFGGASPHASIAAYLLGTLPGGFTSLDLTTNSTTNQIILSTGNLITGASYWTGLTSNTWNGSSANWADDKAGTIPALSIPGQGTDVVFTADNISGGTVATTLEQNFKIASLTFEAGTATPNLVTIAPGAVSTNRLEIATQSSTAGIAITTGGPATASISAPVRLTGDQTWNVADAASNLRISGALQGGANLDLEKIGAGRVTLATAADTFFNTGTASANVTISNGTLEILNVGALGTTANSNLANIHINGGAFYYNNGTTGTVANALTLGGGTLSAGGNTQIYSGAVNSTAASTIQLQDSNAASTTARSLTLAGVVSGAGAITVTGNSGLSGNNRLNGTLTLRGANSGWSGAINLARGTITATDVAALGTGNIAADNGNIVLNAGNGATFSLSQNIDLNSGGTGILEIGADNSAGTPTLDMTGNLGGVITLTGTGSTAALRLRNATDNFSVLNLTNSVVLANEGSISVVGPRTTTISGVISETGGPRALFVNDDRGGWGQTNTTLALTGLNTFTGNVTVDSGVLEYDTVTNIGGAPSALGQGSAINMNAATLRFIGTTSQTTDRPINQIGASTYSANGTGGASIDYQGLLTAANGTAGQNITFTGTTGSQGIITGGFVQVGSVADTVALGATWDIAGSSTVADDLAVSNAGAILNVNTANALNFGPSTENTFVVNTGAVANINASQTGATPSDRLFVAQSGTGAATLNLGANNLTVQARLILGERTAGLDGTISGTGGTLTITNGDLDLGRGTISANLATVGTVGNVEKFGPGTVVLSGNNSGLTSTAATLISEGTLELLYTTDNNTKLRALTPVDMRGATLVINGNNGAATSQDIGGLRLTSVAGNNLIDVNGGTLQDAVLNMGTVARNLGTGTVRFNLPSGAQTSTNGVTTISPNSIYGLLGQGAGSVAGNVAAYATVTDATGTWFATKSAVGSAAGNIVAVTTAAKNDVSTWSIGEHVTDETTGYTGTVNCIHINSLRYDAAGGSDVNVATGGVLSIGSGGILITANVTSGTPGIFGGTLTSGSGEMVVTNDSSQTFEISADIRAAQAITKSGTGTVELSGSNTGTGQVTVAQGTLQLTGGSAIGDLSRVVLAGNVPSTLQLLNSETIGRIAGGNNTVNSSFGTIAIGANTLTINHSGASDTYAGVFTGTGGLVRQGTHNMVLTGQSTGYTGAVTVNGGGGLLQLANRGQLDASSFTLNSGGALLLDNNTTTRSGTRILDTTAITLNSANGALNGETRPRGLAIRTDQDATLDETVGVVTINSGASYVGMEATTANDDSDIIASNFVRTSGATLNVRGTNLGTTNAQGNQFRIGDAGNQTAFIAALVGGAGGTATPNISIVPWAIGETTTGALADANMGNSLVTYVSGAGIRPLNLATEYSTFAAASTATSNIRQSLTTDLLGVASATRNALVLHNANTSSAAAAVNVSGVGAGGTLAVTSGAILFTVASNATAAHNLSTNLGGFDSGITTAGASPEYVIHVVNPTSAANSAILNATISSPLTSTADITKSGRGTLILTGTNTAGGGANKTTINEGVIEIADLDNIGGSTGDLVFAGGTLRLGAGLTDDITTRNITFLNGGGTINTNGLNPTLAGSIGSGSGGLTKAGAGTLTLNGAATYTGDTVISAGTVAVGVNNATGVGGNLIINGGTGLVLGANSIGHGIVTTAGASPQISGTGTINASTGIFLNHTGNTTIDAVLAGAGGLLKAQANIVTLTGANTYTGTTELQAGTINFSTIGNVGGGASNFGAPTTTEDGIIRTGLTTAAVTLNYTGTGSTSNRIIAMQGTTGGLTITQSNTAGAALNLGVIQTETPGAKTLTLNGSSTAANSVAQIHEAASGALSVTKGGTGTWVINGTNTYTGNTVGGGGGVLRAGSSQAFGTVGSVTIQDTNSVLELANGVDISRPLTVSNTGNTKTLRLLSGATSGAYSGTINVAETGPSFFDVFVDVGGSLTASGVISGGASSAHAGIDKRGAGTLVISNANTYRGTTTINDGIVNIQNATALGATTEGTTVASGATLQVEGGIVVGAEALTINGTGETGQNGALVNVTGSNSWAGAVTLGSASTISTDDGSLTVGGNITLGANTLTSTGDNGGQTVINGNITGTGGLTVNALSAAGHTLTLDPGTSNTFSGATAINSDATLLAQGDNALAGTSGITVNTGGTLLLGGVGTTNIINNSAAINLNGGTFNTANLSETVGTLTLSLSSVIDLANGANNPAILTFGNSSGTWTGLTLSIWNWTGVDGVAGGPDQLLFSSFANIDTNLSSISFYSDSGSTLLGNAIRIGNEVLPVPEPTGVAVGLALFGLAGWRERRRSAARRRDERTASRQ